MVSFPPDVKHAFLSKEKTIAKNGKGLGIEHAKEEDIRQAIANVYTPKTELDVVPEIPLEILVEGKLIGHPNSKDRRTKIGELLKIGYKGGI